MNYFSITAILNSLTSALACIFILLNNTTTKTNQYFALFAFAVSIWAFFFRVYASNEASQEEALLAMRIAIGVAIFIPTLFLHFATHLINENGKHLNTLRLLYLFTCIIALTAFSPLFIKDAKQYLLFKYWPEPGPTYIFHTLNYVFVPLLGFKILYSKIKITAGHKQKQLKLVFWGVLLAYLGGLTNFPLSYNFPLLPIGNVFVSFYIAFITYAIFKYQLMDINIILKKSLIYTILISIITVFYLILIYLTEHIIQSLLGYKSLLVSIISATGIALAFIPLKNFVQDFVEKSFFSGSYTKISEENDLLRDEVAQTEKFKVIANLASNIAHEIKNPLTALKTFNEYLPQKKNDPEFFNKYQTIVAQELERINNLAQELLAFAKPCPPQMQQINPNDVINQVLHLVQQKCTVNKIDIETEFKGNIHLDADPNQLKQALLNLILNSLDAMSNGGILRISTKTQNIHYTIDILDTGCGIDPKNLPHIFEPFYTKKEKGTGLGLAITQGIVEKHGGKLTVESKLNQGTTFRIILPI